jgi:hypothetical protein
MAPWARGVCAAVVGFALAGCASPIAGDWVSIDKLGNGQFNKLSAGSDGTSDALIWATHPGDPNWVKFHFTGTWQESSAQFGFQMHCDSGPCTNADFRMDCEVIDESNGEVNKLDCKANQKWEKYPFHWQQDI